MASAAANWEPVPTYSALLWGILEYLEKNYRDTFIIKKEHHPTEVTWHFYYNISNRDILHVVLLSIALTILRHLSTEWIFKPLAHHYALTPTNQRKLPESAWRFIFHFSIWSYIYYTLILSGKYRFFQQPSTIWHNWTLNEPLPGDIYIIYLVQCGFYFHSLYAALFVDTWRKDSYLVVVHHVVTLILILFSYSLRYHNIGCLLIFVHDDCEILLEFAKLNVYFKIQGNSKKIRHEIMANISFLCFTVAWFVGRLYWYPLKVLYSATSDLQRMNLVIPCHLLLNSMLWILQLLNIYWFLLIIQVLYRSVTGREMEDIREYDVEGKNSQEYLSRSSNHHNLQTGIMERNDSCDANIVLNGDADGIRNQAKKES